MRGSRYRPVVSIEEKSDDLSYLLVELVGSLNAAEPDSPPSREDGQLETLPGAKTWKTQRKPIRG